MAKYVMYITVYKFIYLFIDIVIIFNYTLIILVQLNALILPYLNQQTCAHHHTYNVTSKLMHITKALQRVQSSE